jgi:hypothetical protein
MSEQLRTQIFKHWPYEDIATGWQEVPVRIYYYSEPTVKFLEFHIVELHGADIPEGKESWEILEWDIDHSHIVIIGAGYFSQNGFGVKIDSDLSTECKTYETIFSRLQQIYKSCLDDLIK